ncbi:UNVERIFIED_CONTAM: hypothetical protein HHA_262130 [Hammondia hammondi]|eukprot:XP_008882884.1 hypothetical protein HHA_262130 [Hammondia hammondi]
MEETQKTQREGATPRSGRPFAQGSSSSVACGEGATAAETKPSSFASGGFAAHAKKLKKLTVALMQGRRLSSAPAHSEDRHAVSRQASSQKRTAEARGAETGRHAERAYPRFLNEDEKRELQNSRVDHPDVGRFFTDRLAGEDAVKLDSFALAAFRNGGSEDLWWAGSSKSLELPSNVDEEGPQLVDRYSLGATALGQEDWMNSRTKRGCPRVLPFQEIFRMFNPYFPQPTGSAEPPPASEEEREEQEGRHAVTAEEREEETRDVFGESLTSRVSRNSSGEARDAAEREGEEEREEATAVEGMHPSGCLHSSKLSGSYEEETSEVSSISFSTKDDEVDCKSFYPRVSEPDETTKGAVSPASQPEISFDSEIAESVERPAREGSRGNADFLHSVLESSAQADRGKAAVASSPTRESPTHARTATEEEEREDEEEREAAKRGDEAEKSDAETEQRGEGESEFGEESGFSGANASFKPSRLWSSRQNSLEKRPRDNPGSSSSLPALPEAEETWSDKAENSGRQRRGVVLGQADFPEWLMQIDGEEDRDSSANPYKHVRLRKVALQQWGRQRQGTRSAENFLLQSSRSVSPAASSLNEGGENGEKTSVPGPPERAMASHTSGVSPAREEWRPSGVSAAERCRLEQERRLAERQQRLELDEVLKLFEERKRVKQAEDRARKPQREDAPAPPPEPVDETRQLSVSALRARFEKTQHAWFTRQLGAYRKHDL